MPERALVLFAREPRREAREKGLDARAGEDLFAAFASGWAGAARAAGARLVVACPAEDRAAWRRLFRGAEPVFLPQRGRSFGERLERCARDAAALGGRAILVGGDVPPSAESLRRAFDLLDRGADAVLAAAPDGGVSLLALPAEDLDLLGAIAPRRRDVFARLSACLRDRGRDVELVAPASDVDGRRRLKTLLRLLPPGLRAAARTALSSAPESLPKSRPLFLRSDRSGPAGLRAPPNAA